jgi:hypothetical protein
MTYSVWNQGAGLFDYYETAKAQREVNVEPPGHLRGGRQLGATPEEAAWPLPAGAKRIGQGSLARGRIAGAGGGALGAFALDPGLLKLGMLGLSAFLVWKYVLKS